MTTYVHHRRPPDGEQRDLGLTPEQAETHLQQENSARVVRYGAAELAAVKGKPDQGTAGVPSRATPAAHW